MMAARAAMHVMQGTIVDTDNTTYISIRIMEGYGAPKAGKRVVFFDGFGAMQPLYQASEAVVRCSLIATVELGVGAINH